MSRPENVVSPAFFELLTPEDQKHYETMRHCLANSEKRYKKDKRVESLQEALQTIHNFCIRGDMNDWRRCLICGVCWMGIQGLAINTRQLRLLIDKCKSSINGALSKMGYETAPAHSTAAAAIVLYIPFLRGNFVEQRQWTVRRRVQLSPLPYKLPDFSPVCVSKTPHPVIPQAPEPVVTEIKGVFGVEIDVEDDTDDQYNFITDPCCCCPGAWDRNEGDVDEFFAFA